MKNQSGNGKYMKSFLQTKIAMLLLGLAMCLSLALGITLASPTATAGAETALAPYSIIYIEGIERGQPFTSKASRADSSTTAGIWEQTAIIHIWAIRPRGMLPSIRTAF